MEGKLNIFGSNHSEVGSLSENLVLNTAGKVKIRFGLKFIDLIDDKGNINVKIPKVLTKVDSKDEIDSIGFYLLDGDLYVNLDRELIQITGVEEEFISYGIELDLTQELIELAQKNIGLSFSSIKDAQKVITKGIVFVDGRMYYINGGAAKEIPLNDPLIGINDSGLSEHPLLNNSAILWLEGSWKYVPIITYLELEDFKRSLQLDEEEEEEEESEEEGSIFDPIQYSKVYTLKSFGLEIEEYAAGKFKATGANFSTLPSSKLQNNDICIISINGIYCTLNGNTIEPETKRIKTTYEVGLEEFLNEFGGTDEDAIKEYCNTQDSGTDLYSKTTYEIEEGRYIVIFTNESDRPAEEIYTFNFRYKDGGLVFIDKDGSEVGYPITEVTYEELKLYVFTFGEDHYAVRKTAFNNKHLYVKAEQSKKEKFKIDYNNAEIALEENYPTNSEGETDKPKIIPHTVLGDLDDKSEYYNSPAKSFRTYKEKKNSLGLFSDLAVFVGTEFRLPLDYKEPEIPEEESEETEIEYLDTEVYNFPRYSKTLNEILCTKHKLEDLEENDVFKEVIPSIEYLTKFEEYINLKFEEIILEINDSVSSSMPIGAIIMWSGSSDALPEGWNICDGGTYDGITTPDLRNKFIIGAGDKYSIGSSGGNKEITLTTSQLPSHSHEFYDYLTLVHGDGEIHTGTATINGESMTIGKHSTTKNPTRRAQTDDSGHSDMPYLKHKTSSEGSSSPIDITPPYYALSYIMKTKETVIKDSNGEETEETEESEDTNNQ